MTSGLSDITYIHVIHRVVHPSSQIFDSKLSSIKQVLFVLFYNLHEVKLNIHESCELVICVNNTIGVF